MTFFWFDLETFGRNSRYDRIAQFAGIRTDEDLQIIGEPIVLHGRLSPDYLPEINACLITGITPQIANRLGVSEAELLETIDKHLSVPNTCAVGYNSIAFDDEFIRNLYYRNLRDPYEREWRGGNSRWDLIDLTRATRDLRPKSMNWPPRERGNVSVKLELLAKANNIHQKRAHDALSDVYATIGLARLLKNRQSRLFNWAFRHREKKAIRDFIEEEDGTPLIYTSYSNFDGRGNTGLICPIAYSPTQPNRLYASDLSIDPRPLLDLDIKEVRRLVFSSQEELDEQEKRIPLRSIMINKCPFLAPMSELTDNAAKRLGINVQLAVDRYKKLRKSNGLVEKVLSVFSRKNEKAKSKSAEMVDPDLQIYGGFFPSEDRKALKLALQASPKELKILDRSFKDSRIPEMIQRYIRRNFPELLTERDLRQWKEFCASRLAKPPLAGAPNLDSYKFQLGELKAALGFEKPKLKILQDLEDYARHLEVFSS